jgi:hypothetical protein
MALRRLKNIVFRDEETGEDCQIEHKNYEGFRPWGLALHCLFLSVYPVCIRVHQSVPLILVEKKQSSAVRVVKKTVSKVPNNFRGRRMKKFGMVLVIASLVLCLPSEILHAEKKDVSGSDFFNWQTDQATESSDAKTEAFELESKVQNGMDPSAEGQGQTATGPPGRKEGFQAMLKIMNAIAKKKAKDQENLNQETNLYSEDYLYSNEYLSGDDANEDFAY